MVLFLFGGNICGVVGDLGKMSGHFANAGLAAVVAIVLVLVVVVLVVAVVKNKYYY